MTSQILGFFVVVIFALSAAPAAADELLIQVNEVPVYGSPTSEAEVISTLFRGDAVPVSPKSPQGYRKVLLIEGGRKRIGYVKNTDLRSGGKGPGARIVQKKKRRVRSMQNKLSFGLSVGGNYQYQGARSRSSSDGSSSISALSGMSYLFGGFVEIPFTPTLSAQAYVQYKNVAVTGSAKYSNSVIPSQDTDTILKQQFIDVGALLKVFPSTNASWWWGGGGEWQHAMSGTLKYSGFNEISLQGSDLPNFFFVYGAIGANFPLTNSIFLMADLRVGTLLISSPMIYEADALLHIGYVF
jgi:hypothetical protein